MKIETWYDMGCDMCGRHWSTDFEHGFEERRKGFSAKAKKEGWKFIDDKNICPVCAGQCGKTTCTVKRIPKKYMFTGSFEGGGFRKHSPAGEALSKMSLEDMICPCCSGRNLRIAQFGEFGFFDAYRIVCDSCDWECPTEYNADYGETVGDFKTWLEAYILMGYPKEMINEDLTLYFYPEGEWREKEREERGKDAKTDND